MTKREKAKIEKILDFLIKDEDAGGNFTKGFGMLCEMVGRTYPAYHSMKNSKPVDIRKLMKKANEEKGKK